MAGIAFSEQNNISHKNCAKDYYPKPVAVDFFRKNE